MGALIMTTLARIFFVGTALAVLGGAGSCGPGPGSSSDMGGTGGPDAGSIAPTLTLVAPASAVNSGETALVLTGTGFAAGATVTIGGVPATSVVVVSSTRITCNAPKKPKTCGPAAVVVTNPGSQTVSAANLFAYRSGTFGLQPAKSTAANSIPAPGAVIFGDWNRDSSPDLAISNQNTSSVSTLLGQSAGTFASAVTTQVGSQPRGLFAADLDDDKKLDLVVANSGGNSISVLLGGGDGSFTVKGSTNSGIGSTAAAAGDFDGDGKLDVAVANPGTVAAGGSVSVLLGNGDGTFKLPAVSLKTGAMTNSVIARDVNGDSKLDVVATSSTGVDVILGNGNGTFATAVPFLAGVAALSVGAADFNGDGKQDLFAINASTNNLSVLLNAGGAGSGLFAAAKIIASGGDTPVAVISADLDGDGRPDLATANSVSNDVSALLGNGNGTFAAIPPLAVGGGPRSVAGAELNGDGSLDLVSANATSGNISVLLSQCN